MSNKRRIAMKKVNETNKVENSKDKIMEVATKLFAEKGFDGVSTRDICKQANINISMISYYFGGKQELYQAIIEELIKKHTEYIKIFISFDIDIDKLSKKEKINILYKFGDKMIDFLYTEISSDLLLFMFREQQNSNAKQINIPALKFINKLMASILNKKENDRQVILSVIFFISQINSPKIFSTFSLKLENKKEFSKQDIQIIRDNLKKYISVMF
jgi:AcrR family transcriptional regulator